MSNKMSVCLPSFQALSLVALSLVAGPLSRCSEAPALDRAADRQPRRDHQS